MGFTLDISVPVFSVFVQGLLSFFSPCVLPLIPLYIGYLSGGTMKRDEDGNMTFKKSKVIINTLFFIIGVSFAFIILGLGVSALGTFLKDYQIWFTRVGGVLIILLGAYQLGIFGSNSILGNEHKLPFKLDSLAMSPITALIMGFTFSFAWTPCVGPMLTSVLLMTASAGTQAKGFLLILVYTLGFVLPFILVGLFTTSVLNFIKSHLQIVKYTVKIGGIIMILIGVLMLMGKMNAITGSLTNDKTDSNQSESDTGTDKFEPEQEDASAEADVIPAPDFTLVDQYGMEHTLSDYKGKTVFINFWATWCMPCRNELPHIQTLYEEYDREGEDALIILTLVAPEYGNETTIQGITKFVNECEYTFPVLMDTTGEIFMTYGISAFPTTFMIDRDGNVYGYVSGQLTEDMMHSIVSQTMNGA